MTQDKPMKLKSRTLFGTTGKTEFLIYKTKLGGHMAGVAGRQPDLKSVHWELEAREGIGWNPGHSV